MRQLALKGPFSKSCSCGLVFTSDAMPIYAACCGTFTHTVYWLRDNAQI